MSSPAAEVAGYGCEARLRGLDLATPDYLLKLHTPQAMRAINRMLHDAARVGRLAVGGG